MTNIHQSRYEPSKNSVWSHALKVSLPVLWSPNHTKTYLKKIIGISFDDIFTHDLNSTLNSGNVLECKVAQASSVKHILVQVFCEQYFVKHIFKMHSVDNILWNIFCKMRFVNNILENTFSEMHSVKHILFNTFCEIFKLFCGTYLCLNQNCSVNHI